MPDPTRRLPPALVETAREYADGRRVAVEPRNAATVVLLRSPSPGFETVASATSSTDGELLPLVEEVAQQPSRNQGEDRGKLEVYLLRRHVGMEFAAGMSVFPGGGVDDRDADLAARLWAGPSPEEWGKRLGCDTDQAKALVCAAVRETFEESGVLLAGTDTTVVADTTGDDWEADRVALESRALAFSELLERRGLVLRTDLLAALGAWLTPVFEPRRYRTYFFVATLPAGQRTRDVSTESDRVHWSTIRAAVASVDAGEMLMLPPTYCTLLELYDAPTPAAALEIAAAAPADMVEPIAVFDDEGATLEIPDRFAELYEKVHGS
ncbi:NUDIX hydrolase [Nocardioides speluncae]|uniref:NUDIX hydrolase n=1 Tax=Nocardioides speluncae TaxID=2670337 RepID=UPI000D688B8B|nr:NUDIX hydrolase [Nocardioides speluncae]